MCHVLNLCMNVVNDIQQSVLVASNLRVVLLCGCPAIKELAHGHDNPVVRAIALQHEQNVRHLHKPHAQHAGADAPRALGCARCLTCLTLRSDMLLHMLVIPSAAPAFATHTARVHTQAAHSMHGVDAYSDE